MTVDKIIEALGGTLEVSRLCSVGPSAVSNWKDRGSIPVRYWPSLIASARERKRKDITLEALVAARPSQLSEASA